MKAEEQALEGFRRALRERGLKATAQREDIARVFFSMPGHMSVEELCAAVRKVRPRVGYATVYRTVRVLKECGLASERHFEEAGARYERGEGESHHDHLICERCGRIVEFASDEIERLQDELARRLGFVVSRHRMELYGICAACRTGTKPAARMRPRGRVAHRVSSGPSAARGSGPC